MSCRERHRGPVVMVTQAASGAQRLQHDLPILADFPCCHITAKLADSRYPPLQWQQRAAKVAVQRAAAQGSWLQVKHHPVADIELVAMRACIQTPNLADFPCCHMTPKLADSRYPPLQWQQWAAW